MVFELFAALLFAALIGYMVFRCRENRSLLSPGAFFGLVFGGALLVRLLYGYFAAGFGTDIALFKAWGQLCNEIGYNEVYFQNAQYLDYPPGYLYVLSLLDGIRGLFGIPQESAFYTMIIKLPSIFADMAIAWILYRAGKNKLGENQGMLLSTAYLFCPAVIINSAAWGQIDALCTLILFTSLYLLYKRRILPSAIVYGIAVAFKPQMLIFAPIYLFSTLYRKQFLKLLAGVAAAIATILLLALPFTKSADFSWLIRLYQSTMDYYAYYTVNAYNFWAMIGQNWGPLPENNDALLFVLNWSVPAIATALCGVYLYRVRTRYSLFLAPALLMATVFMFAVKMHERYLFPVLVFLLIVYILSKDRRFLLLFGGFATLHFINVSYVLFLSNEYISPLAPQIVLLSAAHLILYGYLIYLAFWGYKKASPDFTAKFRSNRVRAILPEKPVDRAMHKRDYLIAGGIALIYSLVAFWNLGSTQMANTAWEPQSGQEVVLALSGETSSMTYVSGVGVNETEAGRWYKVGRNFQVAASPDGQNWQDVGSIQYDGSQTVFAWKELSLPEQTSYVKLTALDGESLLNETAFKTADGGGYLEARLLFGEGAALLDEQDTAPLTPSYYNSTYFDEIYHARTAYEHILGVEAYESTHPTLGKLIIAASIQIFGMNPFGWRFAGTLFGVLMLPVLYHILKRLFGKSGLAAAGTLLFAFDFMHFTQTRIATIDTYAVFFILLMYDAMLVFIQKDFMRSTIKSLLVPLMLSGVFMGLGAASKWTCAYGAVGLAVLFFAKLILTYRAAEPTDKKACLQRIFELCLWCVIFFITVPLVIYFIAFLPLTLLPQNTGDIFRAFERFMNYQTHMFRYHAGLVATHAFASPWYEWPLDIRSIWYAVNQNVDGMGSISTISALGNPLLWWGGLAALLASVWLFIRERRQALGFLLTGFGAVYLPWVLVPRLTFIYHYFTAVPFLVIGIIFFAERLMEQNPLNRLLPVGKAAAVPVGQLCLWGFVLVNLVLFALFYPVLSGAPTTEAYANALEWLPTWRFA